MTILIAYNSLYKMTTAFTILQTVLSLTLLGSYLSQNVDIALKDLKREIRQSVTIQYGRKFLDLEKNIINTYVDVSFHECTWKCYAKPRCEALEYRRRTKFCALVWKLDELKSDPGGVVAHHFVNKNSRHCGNETCNRKETCVNADSGLSCKIEECGNPMAGQSVRGNVYSTGGKIVSECVDGSQLLPMVCSSSGDWWTLDGPRSGLTCVDLQDVDAGAFIVTNRDGMTLRCTTTHKTIFQRRLTGFVDFYRDWEDYKYGFGHVCGDYWAGLENVHHIMENAVRNFQLHIILTDWSNMEVRAKYGTFRIDGEEDFYRLTVDNYKGEIGDSMLFHNGQEFSTFDHDNDTSPYNCAKRFHGAWWYKYCHRSNLNGLYYQRANLTGNESATGISWYTWHGHDYSLQSVSMTLRELV